jgi:hypothetical protein
MAAAFAAAEENICSWQHLSTATSDLPVPANSNGQTAALVLDIDKDGINDFVIVSWDSTQPIVWYRHQASGWAKYIIDTSTQNVEAGGTFYDIDGDGALDLVFGDSWLGNCIYWWENPYPTFNPSTPWTRHIIKNSGGKTHHDMMFADVDGDGQTEFISWNNNTTLFLFHIPANPRTSGSWPMQQIYTDSVKREGLTAADIDLDGTLDIIGGGLWFKYVGNENFTQNIIDTAMNDTRCAVGQLISGGRPEIVFSPGDADGSVKWYQWNGSSWQSHILVSNVIHGHSLALADINADGNLDVFVGEMAQWGSSVDNPNAKVRVLYGDGTGTFTEQIVMTGQGVHESKAMDLNGDGKIDILCKPFLHNIPRLDIWINTGVQPQLIISGSTGLDGVTMSGLPGNPVTNGGGLYSVMVSSGWSGTVTPIKAGYIFTPPSRSYATVTADQSGQNYTATQIPSITISGNAGGIDGVTMSGLPGNPVTSGGGFYSVEVLYGWSGTVTPTLTGYIFTPPSRSYTNVTADRTDQDYTDDPPIIPQTPLLVIQRFTINAGKTRDTAGDSFSISGTFNATPQDIAGSTAVYVRLSNESEPIFEGVIPYDSAKLKNSRYSYTRHTGDTSNVRSASFDLNTKTFRVTANKIDLTGLYCPVTVEIEWGGYSETAEANEAIINGKKMIPIQLLSGYADALRIDKASVHPGTTANRDSLAVKGAIAFASGPEDLTQHELTLHWGDQDFTVPAGGFVTSIHGRYKYTTPKGITFEIIKAQFDLEKCTFKFSINNAAITAQTGAVECGITFDTFDEVVAYTLY